uniref:DUF6824 domain-containing protein n=1 Tax=Cyclophora tenuis TaxID=216820 RepID=A0A7S1GQN1_CYCTE|mmetsp:Transcript_733/g.1296  ORF Transcript_733/g.1296 Transcript_733/m.1296 type:complete len:459 (+) Transcript_733:120-1496(+)
MGSDGEEPDVDASTKPTDDWQNITKPGPHDVLCGRGGGTNNHSGNVKFRQMINEHKLRYLAASKVEKPKVAREVVKLWRGLDPPGRFLARKDDSRKGPGSVKAEGNVWYDVGDKKAREKASQCLRERTPDVLPYVREMQRQQDLLTGQGLRLVEQQMRLRNENAMAAKNGYPAPVHSISDSEVANAFSVEHFFTHGFNNIQAQYHANPDDPLSLQQISQDPQHWGQQPQIFPAQAPTSYSGPDLEPVPLPANFQGGTTTTGLPVIPDQVPSSDPITGDDELTLEEYMESMKEYKQFLEPPKEERTKVLESMQENSWVKSFHSIETSTRAEDSTISQASMDLPPTSRKKNKPLDAALKSTKYSAVGQSTRTALSARSGLSGMSAMSTTSKKSNASTDLSFMSGSMFSGITDGSRSSKMSAARGLTSNLSMMSDITDLSETLNQMDLATAAAETTASSQS